MQTIISYFRNKDRLIIIQTKCKIAWGFTQGDKWLNLTKPCLIPFDVTKLEKPLKGQQLGYRFS